MHQFNPWQRYLMGYVLVLCMGAVGLTLVMPWAWPGIVGMGTVGVLAGWAATRKGSRSFRRRLRRLREATDAIGRGELSHRIDLRGYDDFAKLAGSLDRMAARLEEHIQERESLQKDLARAERLALIGELGATVAHEVNNPLDGLQNAVRIIRAAHADNQQTRELLDLMEHGLERIERMVRRLLGLARGEPMQIEHLRVDEVLDDALSFIMPRLNRNGIKVERRFPPEPLWLDADRVQLAQALINLLLNAAEAMGESGRLLIAGRREEETGCTRLEISDTGGGIKADDLSHIFEPFYTTKRGGTGLGLSVVARIVESHRGRIDVRSRAGEGTTFTIDLPARQEA